MPLPLADEAAHSINHNRGRSEWLGISRAAQLLTAAHRPRRHKRRRIDLLTTRRPPALCDADGVDRGQIAGTADAGIDDRPAAARAGL